MRKTKGLIIGLAAAIAGLAAVSCNKIEDNTLRYDNITMGNIVDGVFTSDQGNVFNVVEQTCAGDLNEMERAFIICDVLKRTGEEKNEFDIRLNYIADVLTKDAVPVSEIENIETYMNDAVILQGLWISGGYINMYLAIPIKRSNGEVHELNLLHEKKGNVYEFQIRHDAKGEVLKLNGDNSDMVLANAYASFPVSEIITEEKANMRVIWNAYVENGQYISALTSMTSIELEYNKSVYHQVPQSAVATEAALIME